MVILCVRVSHLKAMSVEIGIDLFPGVAHDVPCLVVLDLMFIGKCLRLVNSELFTVLIVHHGVTSEEMRLVDFESRILSLLSCANVDQVGVILVSILLDPLENSWVVRDQRPAGC